MLYVPPHGWAVGLRLPFTELFRVMVESVSHEVPVNCGVWSLVMLSLLLPESLPAAKSGVAGALTPVSMVTDRVPEVPVLPAASVELADIRCTVPLVEPLKVLAVMEYA